MDTREMLEEGKLQLREIQRGVKIAEVSPDRLVEAFKRLYEKGAYYSTGVGADEREIDQTFKVYHVIGMGEGGYVVLKVALDQGNPTLPTLTTVAEGPRWAEMEIRDMLGIEFEGLAPGRLVLPDWWPKDAFPLRKEFKYNNKILNLEVPFETGRAKKENVTQIPIGPYHPALHEPEYFEIYMEGDRIADARYSGFLVHRGIEKLGESAKTIDQIPFLAERICGICGFTHSTAYCVALENAAGIEVPERAQFIRVILLEIERIHSHLLWVGVAFHLLGFDTGFMHAWRIREYAMEAAEIISGNRKTYGMNLPGGVRRDIDDDKRKAVLERIRRLEQEAKEMFKAFEGMREIVERTKNVGVLEPEKAQEYGAVGPVARASGIKMDVRRNCPYLCYDRLDFEVPVYDGCDVLSRYLVRRDEIFESVKIIEQAFEKMPKGEIINRKFKVEKYRMGFGMTEAPRGENVHFVMTAGGNRVFRWKVRAPSYNNIPAAVYMLKGQKLADAPIIIASIDPCFSCTDRVTVIRGEKRISGELTSLVKVLREGEEWKG